MSRPALEVADIFRDFGAAWRTANAGYVSLGQLLFQIDVLGPRNDIGDLTRAALEAEILVLRILRFDRVVVHCSSKWPQTIFSGQMSSSLDAKRALRPQRSHYRSVRDRMPVVSG